MFRLSPALRSILNPLADSKPKQSLPPFTKLFLSFLAACALIYYWEVSTNHNKDRALAEKLIRLRSSDLEKYGIDPNVAAARAEYLRRSSSVLTLDEYLAGVHHGVTNQLTGKRLTSAEIARIVEDNQTSPISNLMLASAESEMGPEHASYQPRSRPSAVDWSFSPYWAFRRAMERL